MKGSEVKIKITRVLVFLLFVVSIVGRRQTESRSINF
jgi:hypothetical protein